MIFYAEERIIKMQTYSQRTKKNRNTSNKNQTIKKKTLEISSNMQMMSQKMDFLRYILYIDMNY